MHIFFKNNPARQLFSTDVGVTSEQNSLRLCHLKPERDEIWHDFSSTKYTPIDGVGFIIRRQAFNMAAMTSMLTWWVHVCLPGAFASYLLASLPTVPDP